MVYGCFAESQRLRRTSHYTEIAAFAPFGVDDDSTSHFGHINRVLRI
jgi:hypothetical protein